MTSRDRHITPAPARRSWMFGADGSAVLALVLAIATPATVILGFMALIRPLLPPDAPFAGLGIALAAPAVGATMMSFGGYISRSERTRARSGSDTTNL